MIDVKEMTHQNTQEYIGQMFQIRFSDGNTIDLKLERIDLLMEKHIHSKMKRDTFAMIFRGPREVILRQHIYPLYSATTDDPMQLFLVPIAVEEQGILYEAVFN
jgi:hypothetical protein